MKIFEVIQYSFETIMTKIIMDLNCTETADLSLISSSAECIRLSNESDDNDDDDYKTKIKRRKKL